MPYIRMDGVIGKVYVPGAPADQGKKHPCPDCFSCQFCGDDRCRLCRAKEKEPCRQAGGKTASD